MRRRWLAIAVILTVAPGCDNVSWGGASLTLRTPTERVDLLAEAAPDTVPGEVEEAPAPETPSALFAGSRTATRATVVAVGELRRGAVTPIAAGVRDFTDAHLEVGTELVLFSEGARVGRMTVDEVGVDARSCFARPTASGVVELVPSAAGASTFLALPASDAGSRPFEPFVPLAHTYDQRVASLSIARNAMPEVGAPLPPSVLEARKDVQAFRLRGEPGASVAATFLYGDTLAVAQPFRGAYSLFVMGTEQAAGIEPDHVWYRPADDEGKGAPRYFGHLDWNRDGSDEVLLEVLGAEHRWFAALAKRNGSWVRAFEDSCVEATPGR